MQKITLSVLLAIATISLFSINVLAVDYAFGSQTCIERAEEACYIGAQSAGVDPDATAIALEMCLKIAREKCADAPLMPTPPTDLDHDGIVDDIDSCSTRPENFNGYEDKDGCPDVNPDEKIVDKEQENEATDKEVIIKEETRLDDKPIDRKDMPHGFCDPRSCKVLNGDELKNGQRIKTGAGESKLIIFSDGAEIFLGENSFYTADIVNNEPVGTLSEGFMRIKHKIQKAVDFELKKQFPWKYRTNNVPVSIRGTDFTLNYDSLTDTTTIHLFEGKIAVGPIGMSDSPDTDNGQFIENIHYEIDSGKILDIWPDISQTSLHVNIETTRSGELIITLPRELIDSRLGSDGKTGEDDIFFVLEDGTETDYSETATFVDERTLTIPFEYGINEIEIVGTFVNSKYANPDEIVEFYASKTIVIDNTGIVSVVPLSQDMWESLTGDSESTSSLIFGSEGTGDGQFMSPSGIAINSLDNIYVADFGSHRVQKFSPDGVYQLQFGSEGSGPGEFNAPDGIAIDSADNVYVADSSNDRIQKFDSNGIYIMQFGFESPDPAEFNPGSIAIDSSDNIYVADSFNNLIHKFDTSGEYVLQFGSEGSGPGEFYYPISIAIDSSDNIYVADNDNHRIQKFDSSGNYILQFGSEGSGPGEFSYPISIAIDSSDNIYVADSNFRIQRFDAEGEYVLQLDLDPNKFHPGSMAIDSSDNIYVVNYVDNSIQKFEFEDSGLKSTQTKSKGSENPEIKESPTTEKSGCLIATATYGTELAPQVQLLREVRDNVLFSTNSGTVFMTGFNEFYYSFSPTIADLERQSPLFKEVIKTTITPMLSTLSILNYANIDSEQEMLGYGIGIILLNAGIYFVMPGIILSKIITKYQKNVRRCDHC